MSEEDDDSKTEEPTQKRLDEARKKGQLVSTRELNHFCMLMALLFFVRVLGPHAGTQGIDLLKPFITQPDLYEITPAGIMDIFHYVVKGAAMLLLLPLFVTFIAALAPAVLQGKWNVSFEQVKPKFDKLNPLSGFKRIYGMKALVEFLKNLLKISVVGGASVMMILPYRHQLPGLIMTNKSDMLEFAQVMAGRMLIAACVFLFLLSIVDYIYQRIIYMKSMRMSKQELKEEYKQQEGDPHVKQRLRALRREKAQKRMMANVPKADVIVTNPTHYAIALKYDSQTMPAPVVIAKGTDDVAARIRESATNHKIPIIRNPPLARVLYDTTKIDDEIPLEHYQAVAKIIGYVYKLKGKKPQSPPTGKNAAKGGAKPVLKLKK